MRQAAVVQGRGHNGVRERGGGAASCEEWAEVEQRAEGEQGRTGERVREVERSALPAAAARATHARRRAVRLGGAVARCFRSDGTGGGWGYYGGAVGAVGVSGNGRHGNGADGREAGFGGRGEGKGRRRGRERRGGGGGRRGVRVLSHAGVAGRGRHREV